MVLRSILKYKIFDTALNAFFDSIYRSLKSTYLKVKKLNIGDEYFEISFPLVTFHLCQIVSISNTEVEFSAIFKSSYIETSFYSDLADLEYNKEICKSLGFTVEYVRRVYHSNEYISIHELRILNITPSELLKNIQHFRSCKAYLTRSSYFMNTATFKPY